MLHRRKICHALYAVGITLSATCPAPPAQAQEPSFRIVPLAANRLIYDAKRKKIYATVGDTGPGDRVNCVTIVDPLTGKIGPSVYVGSSPGTMCLSDNNEYLFVSVRNGGDIRRIRLSSFTQDETYAMGDRHVSDILPVPGLPNAFIAHRSNFAPYTDSLGLYVNGKLVGHEAGCASTLAQGISPLRLFTYQNHISTWNFDGYDIATDGQITRIGHTDALVQGAYGLAGSINGQVIIGHYILADPETRKMTGAIHLGGKEGTFLFDPRTDFIATLTDDGHGGQNMALSNAHTYSPAGNFDLKTGVPGGVGSPICWEEDGFAYITNGRIVIFRLKTGPILPTIDLSVERSILPTITGRDTWMSYRLIVKNRSRQPATHIFLTDQMPDGVALIKATGNPGKVVASGSLIQAEIGALPAGASASVDITVEFEQTKDPKFFAVVRGVEPDPSPLNNTSLYCPSVPLMPLPDLTGSWKGLFRLPSGADATSTKLSGEFIVRNEGRVASHPVSLRFYQSPDPRFVVGRGKLLKIVQIPALPAAQSFPVRFEIPITASDTLTTQTYHAVIDSDNSEKEATLANNTVAGQVL